MGDALADTTPAVNLLASVRRQPYTSSYELGTCVFDKQLRNALAESTHNLCHKFCAAPAQVMCGKNIRTYGRLFASSLNEESLVP